MTFLVMGRSQDRIIGLPGAGSCFGRTKIRGVGGDIGMVAVGNTHRECRSEYDRAHVPVIIIAYRGIYQIRAQPPVSLNTASRTEQLGSHTDPLDTRNHLWLGLEQRQQRGRGPHSPRPG